MPPDAADDDDNDDAALVAVVPFPVPPVIRPVPVIAIPLIPLDMPDIEFILEEKRAGGRAEPNGSNNDAPQSRSSRRSQKSE